MKAYGRVNVLTPSSLPSTRDGGEWSASCPHRFISEERAHGTHRIGVWLGTRASLNVVEREKITCLCRESNRDYSTIQAVPRRYTDGANPAPKIDITEYENRIETPNGHWREIGWYQGYVWIFPSEIFLAPGTGHRGFKVVMNGRKNSWT
jgi:hypothetical protein